MKTTYLIVIAAMVLLSSCTKEELVQPMLPQEQDSAIVDTYVYDITTCSDAPYTIYMERPSTGERRYVADTIYTAMHTIELPWDTTKLVVVTKPYVNCVVTLHIPLPTCAPGFNGEGMNGIVTWLKVKQQ